MSTPISVGDFVLKKSRHWTEFFGKHGMVSPGKVLTNLH